MKFRIKILCLDREFYSTDVFDFLQQHNIPHIVPVVKNGTKIKMMLIGNKSLHEIYIMKKFNEKVELDIVIDVKYMKGKRSKNGCENLGFVVFGIDWSPRKVSTTYRRGFAIESSYRMRNQVKPKPHPKMPLSDIFMQLVHFFLKLCGYAFKKSILQSLKLDRP